MVLDPSFRQHELSGDGRVRQPLGNQRRHLGLASGEQGATLGALGSKAGDLVGHGAQEELSRELDARARRQFVGSGRVAPWIAVMALVAISIVQLGIANLRAVAQRAEAQRTATKANPAQMVGLPGSNTPTTAPGASPPLPPPAWRPALSRWHPHHRPHRS